MQNSPPLFLILLALAGVLGVALVVIGIRRRPAAISRGILLAAILPAIGMLGLFFSLAFHMHERLGGWPASIGTDGFSPPLSAHVDAAAHSFSALLLVCVFVWPIAVILSAFVRPWRGALLYLGVFAVSCFACFAATLFAPSPFLYWWWD